VLTEDILAPHRAENGGLGVAQIPRELFTSTWMENRPTWLDFGPDLTGIVALLAFTRFVPILKSGREWVALEHQCGGLFCQQLNVVATPLRMRPEVFPGLLRIARKGAGLHGGYFWSMNVLASDIANYVRDLAELGLDCECTWPLLTEAVYPIDATAENLKTIAADLPDLSCAIEGELPHRYDSNVAILVIAENSD